MDNVEEWHTHLEGNKGGNKFEKEYNSSDNDYMLIR